MSLPTPPPGFLVGIDTSRAQGAIAVSALAAVDFCIAKATDGLRDIERTWVQHAAAVLAAGKVLGAYGVLEPYASTEAEAQATHFANVVAATPGECLVALDFELGKGRPASDLLRAARIWLDTVEARLNRRALIYTAPAFWNTLVRMAGDGSRADVEAIAERPLWLADYLDGHHVIDPMASRPPVPAEWPGGESIWQVGPFGATLPGGVAVDVNYFEGDVAALRAIAEMPG